MDQLNINILEADIERLSKNIKEKNYSSNEQVVSRETVKEALVSMANPVTPSNVSAGDIVSNQQMILEEENVLPSYMQNDSDAVKLEVEKLIDLTFRKGITAGALEAQGKGPYVMDAYHDALTDKLYEILKQRDMI